jgi:hypothetical protein
MKHELKTLPEFFQAAWVHDKTFEIRNNDRGFKERDEVWLQEWDPHEKEFTGREIHGFITYLTSFHQKAGWVVFSLTPTLFSE